MKRSTLLARQGRMPTGLLGQVVARIMARETLAANLIALDALDLAADDRVLEVGFGHGRTLAAAAKIVTRGYLAGVDPSDVMLGVARKRNAAAIRAGRMELKPGMSAHLPFADADFTKALAVHTIYFWQRPERDLAEIHRVLAPGGRLVLGFRPSEDEAFVRNFPPEIYHIRPLAEVERLISAVGFCDVSTTSRAMAGGQMAWTQARKPG
ncbi:class I SAM-dependent methyltransferase [Phenylobacterium aquaticum]|uniref:class I SAM-dependent methyltransferase n=1 Tax=Phenylobacterium aquaticum TaxID=1763816 RepID=UPI001F5D29AD|nr:class I SAM-dependent methyltransferase [Phenylobacterium aquaticum]MCI3132823.1 class I SAM-dependent methyltransferase [Phenylobacterium aquaticum]